MRESVRAAGPSDVDALLALEHDARQLLESQRGGLEWLAEHPPEPWPDVLGEVLVATIDEVPLGYLRLTIEGDTATVRNVFVHPGAREVGLGDALLDAAMERARRRGCATIDARALPGDRELKNLYERAGIVARALIVSRRLD